VTPDLLKNRVLRAAPDLLPSGSVRLGSVLIEGKPWVDFNAIDLTVNLPAGNRPIAVEVRLDPGVVNFELYPHPDIDNNDGPLTYGMRGYLCEYYLPIFRHRLEELERGVKLRLDASELTGACEAGLRYLTLLRQHNRHCKSIEIVNIPCSIQQELHPFQLQT